MKRCMYMLENGGASEDGRRRTASPLALLFEALEDEDPDHIAVREYQIFQQAAGKTARKVSSLPPRGPPVRLYPPAGSAGITSPGRNGAGPGWGTASRPSLPSSPTATAPLTTLVGMLYTCAFQVPLLPRRDKVHQGPLPVPRPRLMMDEFCNVALPSDFGKIQSTMRSRNIMSTIVLQNISGLKALFKDDWEGLLGNADTLLYLGGNEQSTHKYISEMLGKETLDVRHRSATRGTKRLRLRQPPAVGPGS